MQRTVRGPSILMKFFTKKHPDAPAYPWRLLALYIVAGILAALCILPYLITLLSLTGNPMPITLTQAIVEQIVNSAMTLIPTVALGLYLAGKVRLDSPYLRPLLYGEKIPRGFGATLLLAAGLGFLTSVLISVVDLVIIRDELLANITQVNNIPVAWRFLTSVYGGVDEELLMRLFIMTSVAWAVWKIRKAKDGGPTAWGMWIAVVVAGIRSGISHLPVSWDLANIDTDVILPALSLNGAAGIVYGWLYWKRGFESAVIAHFTSDVTIQIIVPAVLTAVAA